MTYQMTPELRAKLLEGYAEERENWGDDYTDAFVAKLASLPDGTPLDFDGLADRQSDDMDDVGYELSLPPAAAMALSTDYFGLLHLA